MGSTTVSLPSSMMSGVSSRASRCSAGYLGAGRCGAEVDDAARSGLTAAEDEKPEVAVVGDYDALLRSRALEDSAVGFTRYRSSDVVTTSTKAMNARERNILIEEKTAHAAGSGRITSSCRTSAA